MGITNIFRSSDQIFTPSAKTVDRASAFGNQYWGKKRWNSKTTDYLDEEIFPSEAELHVLQDLFSKIVRVISKEDQNERQLLQRQQQEGRRGSWGSALDKLETLVVKSNRNGQNSRSSSCSSTSSVLPPSGYSDSVLLHTMCVLLGEHINKIARHSTYWSWSVDCFSKLVDIYNLERANNNMFCDSSPRQYIMTTICLLASLMSRTLANSTTVTSDVFDLAPLSQPEKQKINTFLSERVLGFVLFLVETEGSEGNHLAGECVNFILAHITITSSVLTTVFTASKRDKLFQYPRFRQLRIWRFMWIKVILERLLFMSLDQDSSGVAAANVADMNRATISELIQSFITEEDSYVKDHSEILFNCSLESRTAFDFNPSVDQARAFLLGLNDVVENLLGAQRSILTV